MEETSDKITYESLWKAIIRPPRDYYREEDLGPSLFHFNGRTYIRNDFEIIDFQGKLLKVSFIEPEIKDRPYEIMPCVIYIHANASSRVEGINMKKYLLKNDINICAFDFEGSGYSEGEYISLGYHEKNQVRNIVDFVEKYPGVGDIGLWGRSMGAATTLIYASMDKRIKAIVVDSPFSDFRKVAKETCLAQIHVPGFLIEGAISIIGKSIYKKNGMKINEIKAIDSVKNCLIPVIFIHARDDDIVKFQHSLDLFNIYAGNNKELREISGGHNGKRPTALLEYVGRFFSKYLINEEVAENNNYPIKEIKSDEDLTSSPIKKETPFNNYIFDLNQRTKKTIYEEWGFRDGKLNKEPLKKLQKNEQNNHIDKDKEENKNKEYNIEENKNSYNNIESNININQKIILDNKKKENIDKNEEHNSKNDSSLKANIITNSNGKINVDLNINKNINVDSNIYPPKIRRKTIYDDLNIRP